MQNYTEFSEFSNSEFFPPSVIARQSRSNPSSLAEEWIASSSFASSRVTTEENFSNLRSPTAHPLGSTSFRPRLAQNAMRFAEKNPGTVY